MYLRRVTRKNKNNTVAYLQLAHNEWDAEAKHAKAKVIYSFGREDQLDRDVLERLAKSISRFLTPEEVLRVQEGIGETADFLFQSSRRVGGSWTLFQLWRKIGLDAILQNLLKNRQHETNIERLIFAMVANRALSPSSKLGMEDWIKLDTYIPGLEEVRSHQLYRAMDQLLEHQDEIEKQVYYAVSDLLNLEVDLIYFDTTSSYFEVHEEDVPDDDDFRKHGYSKDHRTGVVQTVIGLAVTREGIPIRCWSWPGNTSDMHVVKEVKDDLVGWKLGRVIHVADRGFASEENLRYMQRAGGHYIIGERMNKTDAKDALATRGRYHHVRDNLQVKDITIGDGEARKRYVLVHNPKEAKRQKELRESIITRLKEELDGLRQLSGSTHTKAACHLHAHKTYGKYLRQLKDGTLKINQMAIREAEKTDGKYILRTSDDTLSAEDVALGYKQLLEVEDAFRTLKSTLHLRPMYHRLKERIQAHILLNWLALLLVRIVETQTGDSWPTLRDELERMHVGHFISKNGEVFQRSEPTSKQLKILDTLDIEAPDRFLDIAPKA